MKISHFNIGPKKIPCNLLDIQETFGNNNKQWEVWKYMEILLIKNLCHRLSSREFYNYFMSYKFKGPYHSRHTHWIIDWHCIFSLWYKFERAVSSKSRRKAKAFQFPFCLNAFPFSVTVLIFSRSWLSWWPVQRATIVFFIFSW